ncbi:MAG: AAA family ATPase [Acidimicrobiia bacterium]|nr:AAA family ATPase [Acidimicrobiia bacterium]
MSPAPPLLERRLLFFTGKGGVGKSTVAAAVAHLAASRAKRVLLIAVDAKGSLTDLFERPPVGFTPREVQPGILAMSMDTEASLREYLKLNLKVPVLGRIGPLARALDFVANAAPGVKEILTIGKICWEVREILDGRSDIDLVVVDAAATGHIVAQLGAAGTIRELVDVGPVRVQTDWMSEMLADPAITAVNVVTTPEEMPVAETIELVARVRSELDVPLGSVIVNRVLPELFTRPTRTSSTRCESRPRCQCSRSAPGRGRRRARRRPAGGVAAAEQGRVSAGSPRYRRSPGPLRAVSVRSGSRAAGHQHGRRGARAGDGLLSRDATPPETASASFEKLLAAKEIVVFCGSGGVGKTSVAAAAAVMATVRLGGKVLVLTIDPARRLATALGLEGLGNVEHRVPSEVLEDAGLEPRGELWAAMLDTKQSWDALVMRHAPDEEAAYRILENRLYHNLTGRFVQSHDYIAMERLYEIHASGKYDLIVIDTPPTRNAIDFLEAPKRMADFFGGRLLRWLTLPYRVGGRRGTRVLNVASRPFYQLADRILGSKFLEDIAEFFLSFQTMYDGFIERARAVEHLLHDRRTTFAVVTTLEAAPLREAEEFCAELRARDFHLGALVLNRILPGYFLATDGEDAAAAMSVDSDGIALALTALDSPALDDPARTSRVLRNVGESFRNFAVVAKREAELSGELERVPEVIARVPSFEQDIGDVQGLVQIGRCLFEGPDPGRR